MGLRIMVLWRALWAVPVAWGVVTITFFLAPVHPYTQALISAAPEPVRGLRRERIRVGGEIPSPVNLGNHCRLVGRCPHAEAACEQSHPGLEQLADAHLVRCPPALARRLSATAA